MVEALASTALTTPRCNRAISKAIIRAGSTGSGPVTRVKEEFAAVAGKDEVGKWHARRLLVRPKGRWGDIFKSSRHVIKSGISKLLDARHGVPPCGIRRYHVPRADYELVITPSLGLGASSTRH